jgi:hypothetical protein
MARMKQSTLGDTISGRVGKAVIKQYLYGTVMTAVPDMSNIRPSEKQNYQRNRWRDAGAYYRKVKADPQLCARYAHKVQATGFALSAITMRDFLRPPLVREIDLSRYWGQPGDPIGIAAYDDTAVATVEVTVRDAAGAVIETGFAVEGNDTWHYTLRTVIGRPTPITVEAVATDLPGNRTSLTCSWPVT